MRGRMTPSDSYVQPFKLNQPIIGHVLARVVVSKSDDFTKGDIVIGMLPWKDFIRYQVIKWIKYHQQMCH